MLKSPELPMNQHLKSLSIIKKIKSNLTLLTLVLVITAGCASVKQLAVGNDAEQLLKQSEIFSSQFTGFSLYDIEANSFITSYNSTLKFTPASNTKLLTMYASLKSFQDSIPSLLYLKEDSSVIVEPIGDPTFLYSPFSQQPALEFLNEFNEISIAWPEEDPTSFGSGWAWDDFSYQYQTNRSWWPIYGNIVNIQQVDDSLSVTPSFFTDNVSIFSGEVPNKLVDRDIKFNIFNAYHPLDSNSFDYTIPFEYSTELLLKLLQDTLKSSVSISKMAISNPDTLYSYPIDTVLIKMLKPSDNFIAEQLLLMAARENGYTEIAPFIEKLKISGLVSLTDMVWVDGSGLSRYNLIAPVDQVRLLKICLDEFGWDRMTSLLPTGGEGTLKELYVPDEEEAPYIFAKTGTLSNNHNLSGYLITRSGKKMIFSFMNNHYTRPTSEIKKEMEQFLLKVRDAY
ncbi:D-alanyl-D-alanine carboxypeptidase [Ekhidna sp.]